MESKKTNNQPNRRIIDSWTQNRLVIAVGLGLGEMGQTREGNKEEQTSSYKTNSHRIESTTWGI